MNSEIKRNDEKTRYLIKTLSRTKRKDYENYVVNAIWNRISKKIRPVTQQYVSNPYDERRHYFIDLYFPLINMGIECDELQHIVNRDDDIERESVIGFTIQHELSKVKLNDNYEVCHVKILFPFQAIFRQFLWHNKIFFQKYLKNRLLNPLFFP